MALPLYYNWRNLLARRLSTTLTFVVVSVVVFVLTTLLSFAAGIRASLVASGSARNVIVLKPGATSESTSILRPDEYAQLVQTPGLARVPTDSEYAPAGTPLMSPEVCVQTTLPRRGNGALGNVAIRGVDEVAFVVHPEVRLEAGRRCAQGALEAIAGTAAADSFAGLRIGDEIVLGRHGQRTFRIVGKFAAAGSAFESEVWTPRSVLADAYWRRFASSVCLRLTDPAAATEAIAFADGPSVKLEGRRETQYYDELASKTRELVFLATVLVSIMGVGAIFAVANTMYAAVDGRRREIAMLRTIGFGRGAIVLALMIESLLICTLACAAGLAASAAFNGTRQDFLSDATWTVLSYQPRLTVRIVVVALGVAIVVGAGGAVAPALRAARINILQAVRKG
jgi:putative ABC transport system permease protein